MTLPTNKPIILPTATIESIDAIHQHVIDWNNKLPTRGQAIYAILNKPWERPWPAVWSRPTRRQVRRANQAVTDAWHTAWAAAVARERRAAKRAKVMELYGAPPWMVELMRRPEMDGEHETVIMPRQWP